MKIVRKLTSSGDYSFGYMQNNFITGIQAVAQMIQTKLKLLRGEWWEDMLDGLPVVQEILNVYNVEVASNAAASLCADRIMQVEGVTKVDNIEVETNREKRKILVRMEVQTVYGRLEQVVEV